MFKTNFNSWIFYADQISNNETQQNSVHLSLSIILHHFTLLFYSNSVFWIRRSDLDPGKWKLKIWLSNYFHRSFVPQDCAKPVFYFQLNKSKIIFSVCTNNKVARGSNIKWNVINLVWEGLLQMYFIHTLWWHHKPNWYLLDIRSYNEPYGLDG